MRFRQALADADGKFRRVTGGPRSLGNVTPRSQLIERQACVYLTPLVQELIEVAVGQQPPVQSPARAGILHVPTDPGRAVLRQGVVPLWMVGEVIDFVEVINQQSPRL